MGYYRKKIVGDQSWNQSHTSKPFGLAKLDRPEKCFFVCFLFCFCSLLFHQWRHCPGASYHFNRDPASLQSFSVQLLACFLLFFFGCAAFPNQGWNSCLLQWKRGVLISGPPGNSPSSNFCWRSGHLTSESLIPNNLLSNHSTYKAQNGIKWPLKNKYLN